MTLRHFLWALAIFVLAASCPVAYAADAVAQAAPAATTTAPAPVAAVPAATPLTTIETVNPEDNEDPEQPEDAEDAEDEESPSLAPNLVNPKDLPFADLTDAEIQKRLQDNPASLGPMSVGFTNSGALVNGVSMPAGDNWRFNRATTAWGTQETVDAIATAINQVNAAFPNTPPLTIGDIGDHDGGRLGHHKSHQAGRDADIGFYYASGKTQWFTPGLHHNLDLPRCWALVRAFVVYSDVEMILLDRRIQVELYEYARSIGEDPAWLETVFQYPGGRKGTVLRHCRGHHTHFHVRLFNPLAQEMGRRAYPTLLAMKLVRPAAYVSYYKVRKGDTLASLAARYGVSTKQMRRSLRGRLRPGTVVRVGRKNGVARVPGPLALPSRRIPPSLPSVLAKADWTPVNGVGGLIVRPLTIAKDEQGRRVAMLTEASMPVPAVEPAAVAVAALEKPAAAEPAAVEAADADKDAGKAIGKGAKAKAARQGIRYRVRSGDNLWAIARRYGVSVKDIRSWNGLRSANLTQGQTLLLYVKH
jgi:penicillin-insensitive murein endopeptidase